MGSLHVLSCLAAGRLCQCVIVYIFAGSDCSPCVLLLLLLLSPPSPLSFLLLLLVLGLAVGGCGSTRTCQRHRLIFPWSSSSSRARARLPPFAAAPPPEPESSNPLTVHMLTAPLCQLILGQNGDKTDVIQHQIGQVCPDRAVIRVTETTP